MILDSRYQSSIIDCKTWFDSFGRILGAGVSFAYTSNVKANSGSLRNLPFKVEPCTSPIFHMWPVQEHIRDSWSLCKHRVFNCICKTRRVPRRVPRCLQHLQNVSHVRHGNGHSLAGTTGRLHSEFIRLLFLQTHRETDRFFAASGVQSAQSNLGPSYFHFRRAAFSGLLKSKCGSIIVKASALRVNLNLDGAPIASNSHTDPSHSQTSRLLTSSLSLGVPVPRPTQCMGGA